MFVSGIYLNHERMFVLRRISSLGVQMNHYLGDNYTLIHSHRNKEEFEKLLENDGYGASLYEDGKLYAIIVGVTHQKNHYLTYDQKSFIMNDRGDTFDNLTEIKPTPIESSKPSQK